MPDDTPSTSTASAPAPAPDAWEWRKRRLKDFLLCLSLANLCFIQAWFGILFQADRGYFNLLPVSATMLGALVFNILGMAFLLWLPAGFVRRRGGRAWLLLADCVLCLLLLVPLNFLRINYFEFAGTSVVALAKKPVAMVLAVGLAAVFFRWHRKWARLAQMAVAVFVPMAALTFAHIGWSWLHLAGQAHALPGPRPAMLHQAATDQPRVVWLIFDEMDRRVAFDKRPPDLALPELDRLRREGLDATNSFAPSGNTLLSMPALTTGRSVASATPVSASDLRLVWQDDRHEERWSTATNVFTRARALGLNSAIVGWFHPYDRVLAASASRIDWIPSSGFEQARAPDLTGSMLNQIGTMLPFLHVRQLTVRRVEHFLARASQVVADTNTHLLFIHLPVPHKPGIYRPETGALTAYEFSSRRGYLNNLLLADRVVGDFRRATERAGAADRTWWLVSSDHWWRESHFYDGQFDTRVPFLLKSPRDSQAVTYGAAFNTVVSQDLVLAILRGEVRDHAAAAAWLDRHRVAPPRSYTRLGEPL